MTPEQWQEIEAHRTRICDALDGYYKGIDGDALIDARMPLTALIYVLIDLGQKAGFKLSDLLTCVTDTWGFLQDRQN